METANLECTPENVGKLIVRLIMRMEIEQLLLTGVRPDLLTGVQDAIVGQRMDEQYHVKSHLCPTSQAEVDNGKQELSAGV